MQYRFLSGHTWLPIRPTPTETAVESLFVNDVLIPRLASVGGVQSFANYCKDQGMVNSVTYNTESEKLMSIQLQNQLTADGYPKDIIELLHMCEADTVNSLIQQFLGEEDDIARRRENNWLPMDADYALKIKRSALSASNLIAVGFNPSKLYAKNDKNCGFIKWLPDPPRCPDGSIDIGKLYSLLFDA